MNISEHITLKEATRSSTAKRLGIDNSPNDYQLGNMEAVANNVFEPLREWVGGPIRINSFLRAEALNKAIGGSKRSQHMEGRAIDIDDTHGHSTNKEMYDYIVANINFDQIIWEFGDDENPDWIHVSYVSETGNRKLKLRAERVGRKTKYRYI